SAAATAFRAVPGRGVRAEVEGEIVRVGSGAFLESEGVDLGARKEPGRAVLGVARGKALIAVVTFEDPLKEQAAAEVARLIGAGAVVGGGARELAAARPRGAGLKGRTT